MYRIELEDRRPLRGPWVAYIRRNGNGPAVGVGADSHSADKAVRRAVKEVRYRRTAGEFRPFREAMCNT